MVCVSWVVRFFCRIGIPPCSRLIVQVDFYLRQTEVTDPTVLELGRSISHSASNHLLAREGHVRMKRYQRV